MEVLLLCWEFFKIGLFAIGGGMATIPFLVQIAEKYPHWYTVQMLADMVAVSESTPGPIGINMATYVGFTVAGPLGAVLATFALVLPSFLILICIAGVLERYRTNRIVDAGFSGLRPAVAGLIAAAGFTVLKLALFGNGSVNIIAVAMYLILFACMQWKRLSRLNPVVYIGISALAGIIIGL